MKSEWYSSIPLHYMGNEPKNTSGKGLFKTCVLVLTLASTVSFSFAQTPDDLRLKFTYHF